MSRVYRGVGENWSTLRAPMDLTRVFNNKHRK